MSGAARARPPAVAGRFYPRDADRLRRTVGHLLDAAPPPTPTEGAGGTAFIAPHAAYQYSGPVAARAYTVLRAAHPETALVVLVGPAHFVAVDGVAASSADAFATPLGPVAVDDEARREALGEPGVRVHDDAHEPEHSLEVHLPFLQAILSRFAVLPLLTGARSADVLGRVLEHFWDRPGTVIVVSTDLSHYHDDATARRLDAATIEAITAGDGDGVGPGSACGAAAVRGLLAAAQAHGTRLVLLDYATSADRSGDPSSVVGYAAFASSAGR